MSFATNIENILSKAAHEAGSMVDSVLMKVHGPAKPLSPQNQLQALDNTAFIRNGKWTAEFVISVFDRCDEERAHKAEEEILKELRVQKGELEWSRIAYFLSVPRENINVDLRQVGGREIFTVGPTQYNGIMNPEVAFPTERKTFWQAERAVFEIVPPKDYPDKPTFSTAFAQETGYGIISGTYTLKGDLTVDIDDTIKISDVLNREKLLRHTFLDKHAQPVGGMPELYKRLQEQLSNPTFFYLSASPWQLYLFIHDFIKTNYPFGQIILRDMSYVEIWSFISSLTVGTQEYKEDRMDKIHRWLPNKRFICIGDSTQTDPEAYGTTYRKYPGWIKTIWIRVVEGVDPPAEVKLNSPERFEKAFEDVPRDVWKTFKDPSELMEINLQGFK